MMRISTAFYFQTGLNSLNRQQGDMVHVFQQIGSGKRMVTAADDPLAAAQALRLGQSQSMNARFSENREVAMRALGEEENVLMSLIPQVNGVKTRLIEVANGTLSQTDRETIADVLVEMKESIHGLMNAKDASGQYLFSGSKGDQAPFEVVEVDDGNGNITQEYQYKGNETPRNIQADQTRQIDSSDNGRKLFGEDEESILNVMDRVISDLKSNKPLSEVQESVGKAMTQVDTTYDQILTVRASVGSRMNEIDAIEDSGKMQSLHLSSELSRLEDLDFYTAASQLELRKVGLEAAALAFQKIQSTSLFAMNARG